jgi:phage terminase small subunit
MPGGRRPHITTDVQPWYLGSQRLQPPASLGEAERLAFIDLIASVPAAQFQASDVPLICRWCEACVMAETAAAELREHGMVVSTKEGQKPSPWFTIHQQATKTMKDLALRLKLSPQARHAKAPKTIAQSMSAYERLAMEGDDDNDEAERN